MNTYIEKLKEVAKEFGDDVYSVCEGILTDERFPLWSGSSKEFQHHYGKGGLIQHTFEVVELCFQTRCFYPQIHIDPKELFLSAFFHDVGKMWDYEPIPEMVPHLSYSNWKSSPHKRLIHHISRSALVWSENAKKDESINENYHEKVLHAILSHHTCREYGSPVAPKSRVAWMVTLCDNLSARMYDADTFDVLGRK